MSEAIGTLGTTLKRGLQHIAQVQDVSGPELSTDTDEITNHDSPDGVEEFIPTIKRTGEITFPLVFLPSDPSHDNDTGCWRPGRTARSTATSSRTPTARRGRSAPTSPASPTAPRSTGT